jgi:hypothetical protein
MQSRRIIALSAVLWCCDHAQGGDPPVSAFTLTDGAVSFSISGMMGQRLTAAGGLADFNTQAGGPAQVDHLFQNFVWYRAEGDTREYALSNQVGFNQTAPNNARVYYTEPFNNGTLPLGLNVTLTYTLSDLSSLPERPNAVLHVDISVENLTNVPRIVSLFSYNDLDMGATSSDDSAAAGSVNSRYSQSVVDANPDTLANYTATRFTHSEFVGTTEAFAHFEIGAFPSVRNKLVDSAANNLSDSVTGLSNADYTAGYQWVLDLEPHESLTVSVHVQLNMLPCPADVDRSGSVDVDDLVSIITGWGICP